MSDVVEDSIRGLLREREQIDAALGTLQRLKALRANREYIQLTPSKGRPGRKSMGKAERLEVSERMKRYWATRRKRAIGAG